MQFIDSLQRRTFDRLRIDEVNAWVPGNFDVLCGNHIRSLVTQTKPDLIFITGDMVYGSFDDKGSTFEWFCNFMDSFGIPWAPTFGNHDNESRKGVAWQCEQLEKSKYCVFKRGNVSGNSNYTVGIAVGDELVRVLHMIDSNGCGGSEDLDVIKTAGIYSDQLELIKEKTRLINKTYGKNVPAFCAFHMPVAAFEAAEINAGYKTESRELYTIGVDVPAKNGDFGFKLESFRPIEAGDNFVDTLKQCNIDAVFAGHCHSINTCISYQGIKWVFGLKTGQYDYHIPVNLGGTFVCLDGGSFEISHVPSLVPNGPFPGGAKMFDNFFAEDKYFHFIK
ncbi:MAG: metallophosphoesterase [Clostridia bacterium]|nr:metallophosphoesterase [Clostridia bacterium]